MDIQLKHEDYKYLNIIKDNSGEECVETDFSLPEYMPEILRIIRWKAVPKLNSCTLTGNRVTVDGNCEITIIYTSEDGGLYSFSQGKQFTKYFEKESFINGDDVTAHVTVSYVNGRATGSKRAEAKVGLGVSINVYKGETEDIISIEPNSLTQEKSEVLSGMTLGCCDSRFFSLSDTLPLNEPFGAIVSCNSGVYCTETKKINNKIMIKGEAIIEICYVKFQQPNSTETIKHKIPINQILEFNQMDEKFTGSVNLTITSCDVIPKGEANGGCNTLELSLLVSAGVRMWEEKEMLVLTDVYSLSNNLTVKKEPYKYYKALDEIRENYSFKTDVEFKNDNMSQVVSISGEILNSNLKVENGELSINGALSLDVIYKDDSDSFGSCSKVVDYNYTRKADYQYDYIFSTPQINLISIDSELKNKNILSVDVLFGINASVFNEKTVETLTEISVGEEKKIENSDIFTVYFPENNNESLWNIARRYNTTVEAVAQENDLTGDTTEELKTVIITAP